MSTIGDIGLGTAELATQKERYIAEFRGLPPNNVPNSLRVLVCREPFDDWYTIMTDNGHSEEFEDLETRGWLAARGASEEQIQKTVTQAWNFYRAVCLIHNPKYPQTTDSPLAPKLTAM
jgi:hypothetical protein